ncbi:MAG: Crp/Fnr family transcriptional regulator [Clostridia bacterium]|nr:Crp/Fnr family transcriptional regulator [Clostridia bacterium]
MEKYFEILEKCPLFAGIPREDLSRMLGCLDARVSSFDKKYTVFAEGTPAKYVGILLSGSAQTERIDYEGNRNLLSSIAPGEVFGEAFACAEVRAIPVSVVATEMSEVLLLDCDRILRTCTKGCDFHQKLIFNLMKDLALKSLAFHQKLEVTSKRTTREKLMTYLTHQAQKTGKRAFDIPFDRQALADYLEVDRSGLSAEIGKLTREGILRSRKKHFELL